MHMHDPIRDSKLRIIRRIPDFWFCSLVSIDDPSEGRSAIRRMMRTRSLKN